MNEYMMEDFLLSISLQEFLLSVFYEVVLLAAQLTCLLYSYLTFPWIWMIAGL